MLALAIVSAIAAAPALAQQAPTFTLNVLLKESAEQTPAREFAQAVRSSRPQQVALGDPLLVRAASPATLLEPEQQGGNVQSADAGPQRWVSLTYNALTDDPEVRRRSLMQSELFEAVEKRSTFQFAYSINDQLYAPPGVYDANRRQWALDTLKLPQAFDWTRGRVLIGAVDSGVPGFFNADGTAVPGRPTHADIDGSATQRGNIRRHLSYTLPDNGQDNDYSCGVPAKLGYAWSTFEAFNYFGHGTHVAGIMSALANNGAGGNTGVSGSCPTCSFTMMQSLASTCTGEGAQYSVNNGVSVLNMSFGTYDVPNCSPTPPARPSLLCTAIKAATDRDIAVVAAAGNFKLSTLLFPARRSDVIAVGATDNRNRLWDEARSFEYPHPGTAGGSTRCTGGQTNDGCGSNFGPDLDLVAPGAQILSTITADYRPTNQPPPCTSQTDPLGTSLYGVCTGTSMSAPYVSGIAGLIRSVNPLLSWQQTKQALEESATRPTDYTVSPPYTYTAYQVGAGIPDAELSVMRALGAVKGATVFNRLTPLFSLVACKSPFTCTSLPSAQGTDSWLFTSSPQTVIAAAKGGLYFVEDSFVNGRPANLAGTNLSERYYPSFRINAGIGASVYPAYQYRNGVLPANDPSLGNLQAGASSYVFSTNRHPASGAELAPSGYSHLVPLMRMSSRCSNFRKHVYAVDEGNTAGAQGTREFFENSVSVPCTASSSVTGYNMDVVEGYIWRAHNPNSNTELPPPPHTKKLFRYYNATAKSWALVMEGEEANAAFSGYSAPVSGYGNALLGYVYPNVDRDGDGLVDGFELTVGTDPDFKDSDCDGASDDTEFPLDALPVSDPVSGPNCAVRALPILLDDED